VTSGRTAAAVLAGLLHLAAASACAAPAPARRAEPAAEARGPVTLAVGETASFDGGKLSVKFVSVSEDSRCPKNEQCVWAGNARVELEVRVATGAPRAVSLDTNKGAREVEVDSYSLGLVDLAPVPVSARAIAPGEYRATLTTQPGAAPADPHQPVR
jgi:hypothetical protein